MADLESARWTPGLHLWWLEQSSFLIAHHGRCILLDPYLSDSLTEKYAKTDKPHVRMTRSPLRGGDLREVDLVLASHRHSDHLDPGTLPDLLAASPRAVLALPEAILEQARGIGLPADRLVGLDAGGTVERAGFRVRAVPSAHEGLDTDEAGHHLYLAYVIESEGLKSFCITSAYAAYAASRSGPRSSLYGGTTPLTWSDDAG